MLLFTFAFFRSVESRFYIKKTTISIPPILSIVQLVNVVNISLRGTAFSSISAVSATSVFKLAKDRKGIVH